MIARLLIADGEPAQVTALCRVLSAEGYVTVGAGSGSEALAALRTAARDASAIFDVLITDLMMPGMDGISLLRAAHELDANLVSILMTGQGTIDTAVDAMKSGALDYILKPFDFNAIKPVLQRALAVRHLRVHNAALVLRVADRTAELESVNRELQAANKELGAFTASISHELRQPLSAMIGFSELLITEKPGPLNSRQKQYLTDILQSGLGLTRLTKDLLRFSRLSHRALNKPTVDTESLTQAIT
jgi:two-component system, sensor histidine kinase and response regulator